MSPYNNQQIEAAVNTVHMNSKRQATRQEVIDYTGSDIQFIGDKCFAYSGKILSTGSEAADDVLLEFTSAPSFMITKIAFQNDITGGQNCYFEVALNDNTVILNKEASSSITEPWSWEILIPPFTKVRMAWGTQTGATNFNGTLALTGQVYHGAERVQGAI